MTWSLRLGPGLHGWYAMPNARLLKASSILELRLTPDRLTEEIALFMEDCLGAKRRAAA